MEDLLDKTTVSDLGSFSVQPLIDYISLKEGWILRCKKHFWKKAQRNPNVVYDLILKSDVWHLDDGINLDSQP